MSYTDSTANLKLPQWQENDYPSWLTDVNGAFRTIDQKVGEQDASIQQSLNDASGARTLATEASNSVTSLSGEVNSVKNDVSEVRELASAASTTANSAMDVAEIAQDTAEEVAGRTANITSDQTSIKHIVNNANSGGWFFSNNQFALRGSNNVFGVVFDDQGNFATRDSADNVVFYNVDINNRITALENKVSQDMVMPAGSSGLIHYNVIGNVCTICGYNLSVPLNTDTQIGAVPAPTYLPIYGCCFGNNNLPNGRVVVENVTNTLYVYMTSAPSTFTITYIIK